MSNVGASIKKFLSKKSFSIKTNVVFALIGGLVIGIGGTLFLQSYNPKDETVVVTGSSVMERVADRNEMLAASQAYSMVKKATDQNKLFDLIDIPFTQNSFWYHYVGEVQALVDMGAATWEDSFDKKLIRVKLPEPTLQNVPNTKVSGVLEEHNNIFNPIHVKDTDEFRRQCVKEGTETAKKNGILKKAKENTAANLQEMFDVALGKGTYTVKVSWTAAADGAKHE